MDRSIPIYPKRQAPGERVARFRRRDVKPGADELRERVFEWASGIIGELREARLALPENLSDRRQDGLEPLLAIAEAAGGEWPQRIRTAALEVFASTAAEDASIGVQLLADIRTIFDDRADDKIYLRGHDRQAAGHREFAMGGLGPRRRLGQEQAGPLPAQVRCCPPDCPAGGTSCQGILAGVIRGYLEPLFNPWPLCRV